MTFRNALRGRIYLYGDSFDEDLADDILNMPEMQAIKKALALEARTQSAGTIVNAAEYMELVWEFTDPLIKWVLS